MTTQALARGIRYFAAAIVCAAFTPGLTGCGGSSTDVINGPKQGPANITGNWELTLTTSSPVGATPVAVYLTSSAGSVSGIAFGPPAVDNLCSSNGCCGTPIGYFSNVALTGTVDADGNLKLGNAVAGNPVFAMTGTVSGVTMSSGSFTLSGACTTQGTVTGAVYEPLDGTYAGTLTSGVTGQSFTISATLDQSSAPNADGYLGLGGTVDVTGYSYISPTAMSFPTGFTFVGNAFAVNVNSASGEALYLTATLSPDGKTLQVTYGTFPSGGGLTQDYGTGTLTLQ